MFLLDVGFNGSGLAAALIVLVIIVLLSSAALIVGFVFLLKWLKPKTSPGESQPRNPNQ